MVKCEKYAHLGNEGAPGFDWTPFEDGWNGCSMKENKKIHKKTKDGKEIFKEKVYSHEPYAQSMYNKFKKVEVENTKDIKKGASLAVCDLNIVDENTMLATVGGGASDILIDLNKETNLFKTFSRDEKKEPMTRESFCDALRNDPGFKEQILAKNLYVKIGSDTEKGSIWDGYVERMIAEFKEQIILNKIAYYAEITGTNGGGFVVNLANVVRAFMPGSMAALNKISDYDSFIGKRMEVMIESWSPRYGFVVSRKKYLNKMKPIMLRPIQEALRQTPDQTYRGRITGATQFGIFVELDEFITGMIHKTMVSDERREMMRQGTIEVGSEIDVYVHKIDGTRVIFSDVPTAERDAVIARREAEDAAEKREHIARKMADEAMTEAEATAAVAAETGESVESIKRVIAPKTAEDAPVRVRKNVSSSKNAEVNADALQMLQQKFSGK